MKKFKKGDIVKVIKQPPNQFVRLVGEVGEIEEFQENNKIKYAYIYTFSPHSCGGMGSVPLDCLVLDTDPKWIELQKQRRKEQQQNYHHLMKRTRLYNNVTRYLANKYKLTEDDIEDIYDTIQDDDEWYLYDEER